jgi:hypothetical protein
MEDSMHRTGRTIALENWGMPRWPLASLASAAGFFALALAGGGALAQGSHADMIRAHCISAAQGGWTDFNPESGHGRARTELYISCMQQHGLAP